MSEKSLRTIIRTIMDKNMELLKLLCLCASYDPVWIILMIFVSCNGVLSQEFPTASSVFTHIFALIIITSACQYELRLLLFVCVCAAGGGEYRLSLWHCLWLNPAFVWVNTHLGYIQSTNHEKARYNFRKFCIFLFLFQTSIVQWQSLIYSRFAWFISYFTDSLLSHVMFAWAIYVSNPQALVN